MTTPIAAPGALPPVQPLGAPTATGSSGDFSRILHAAVSRVETSSSEARSAAEKFVRGENIDVHTVALAAQRSSLELDLFLQVRNKVVQAYQEVMRMQL